MADLTRHFVLRGIQADGVNKERVVKGIRLRDKRNEESLGVRLVRVSCHFPVKSVLKE
jgi:hypothetical protein